MAGDRDYMAEIAESDRFKTFAEAAETGECLDRMEQHFIQSWASTDKPEIAHEIWHRVRAIRQFRQEVQARVDAGKIARAEMKRDGDYQASQRRAQPKTAPRKRKATS